MKKLILTNLLLVVSAVFAFANTNSKAVEYFNFGLNKAAKNMLLENVNSGTQTLQELSEAYYYLGEIAFAEHNRVDAEQYYKKGEEADPTNIFNKIGLVKLDLKINAAVAEKSLAALVKINKKDMLAQVAAVRAYIDNRLFDKAQQQIAAAKKVNAKYAPLFVAEGDLLAQKNEIGEAGNRYETAILFDKNCKEAYVKYARFFTKLNPTAAIEKLTELLALDENSPLTYRELGEVYYQNSRYTDAANAYEKYVKNDKYSVNDLSKYAIILYSKGTKEDYEKSLEIINSALKYEPDNKLLNRLYVYNKAELKDSLALDYSNDFLKLPNVNFVAQDYIYNARLLNAKGLKDEAVAQYEKALQIDTANTEIYKELSNVYYLNRQYPQAIENYKKFIQKSDNTNTTANVNFSLVLGQYCYVAAYADSTTRQIYCAEGDTALAYVIEMAPRTYLGYFWRARIQNLLDPESKLGLAKPYYEAAAEILAQDPAKNSKNLIECYRSLGAYYFEQKDYKTTKSFQEKILELNPTDENAIEALNMMKNVK
ncbi:MAG: tetratricopeptide repeat protein [Prevotellaceae bacterium]|jgi:tetratricopeptide (TPR) repeat protein|nr:tetratricopeptide repeat protein [Prevotellaceae bacterium]